MAIRTKHLCIYTNYEFCILKRLKVSCYVSLLLCASSIIQILNLIKAFIAKNICVSDDFQTF